MENLESRNLMEKLPVIEDGDGQLFISE